MNSEPGRTTAVSILNDVLGPVMRGPSSSHTAASYHLGRMAAALLGAAPSDVRVSFDPSGSYGQVYRQQGVDLGFAMGILGLPLTDARFFRALEEVAERGIQLSFCVEPLELPDHPNCVDIRLQAPGRRTLDLRARSVGGGSVEITRIDGWPVLLDGQTHEVIVECAAEAVSGVCALISEDRSLIQGPALQSRGSRSLIKAGRCRALSPGILAALDRLAGWIRESGPIAFVKQGGPLFDSAAGLLAPVFAKLLFRGESGPCA